jgi:dihydrolipoamide dehydrogenase
MEKLFEFRALKATGRRLRVFDFGIESIGLIGEGQTLQTDASLAVLTSQGTKALRNMNGLGPTTHMGVYQARIASNAILSSIRGKQPSIKINTPIGITVTESQDSKNTFPQLIFTEPTSVLLDTPLLQLNPPT